jgi:anti-anti-sigma regulatory factor
LKATGVFFKKDGNMTVSDNTNALLLHLPARIDSTVAQAEVNRLRSAFEGNNPSGLILDASKLEYISNAGLRIFLTLRKHIGG